MFSLHCPTCMEAIGSYSGDWRNEKLADTSYCGSAGGDSVGGWGTAAALTLCRNVEYKAGWSRSTTAEGGMNEELETRDGLGFACWDGDLAIWGKPEERDGWKRRRARGPELGFLHCGAFRPFCSGLLPELWRHFWKMRPGQRVPSERGLYIICHDIYENNCTGQRDGSGL